MLHFRLVDFLRCIAAAVVMILHWNVFVFESDWSASALTLTLASAFDRIWATSRAGVIEGMGAAGNLGSTPAECRIGR